MTWTATVLEQRAIAGGGVEWVVFHACQDDPSQSFQQCYQLPESATAQDVATLVTARLARVDTPPATVLDLAPAASVVEAPIGERVSDADTAAQTFSDALTALRAASTAQRLGLTTTIDVKAAQATAQALLDTYGDAFTAILGAR